MVQHYLLIYLAMTASLLEWSATLIDLTERNANHIIPSYSHLQVSCRSLVDRYGSSRSSKP